MKTNSKNNAKNRVTSVPKLSRKSRLPALIRVPVPPEVARWQRGGTQDVPYRQITQARAVEITGKSPHTVKRWANGRQAIDSSSLRLLQVWVWGIIPAREFIDAGIFVAHDQRWHPSYQGTPQSLIASPAGYLVTAGELDAFGWLRGAYFEHWQRQTLETAPAAPAEAATAQIIPFAEHLARRRATAPDGDAEQA